MRADAAPAVRVDGHRFRRHRRVARFIRRLGLAQCGQVLVARFRGRRLRRGDQVPARRPLLRTPLVLRTVVLGLRACGLDVLRIIVVGLKRLLGARDHGLVEAVEVLLHTEEIAFCLATVLLERIQEN